MTVTANQDQQVRGIQALPRPAHAEATRPNPLTQG